MSVLEVRVGENVEASLARFGQTLAAARSGKKVKPNFGIGFRTMAQFGEAFTPKRWELVESLKAAGPLTIYALAKRLGRSRRKRFTRWEFCRSGATRQGKPAGNRLSRRCAP